MNDELIYQYSVIAATGFRIITVDGNDLTEDLKKITDVGSDSNE